MYDGSAVVNPDYRLSTRQALVRATQAVIQESRSLDVLHLAGLNNLATWWSHNCYSGDHPEGHVDDPQLTGRCHLPSWVPDWGESATSSRIAKRDLDTLKRLEFPGLDTDFVFDVSWKGENLVAAGIALGRLVEHEGAGTIAPFPVCAFDRQAGKSARWAFSQHLGGMFTSDFEPEETMKTDIAAFAYNVKLHDEGQCHCSDALDRCTPNASERTGGAEQRNPFLFSTDYSRIEHLDWVVVLFGAHSVMYLRADCQIQPNPWLHGDTERWRNFRPPPPVLDSNGKEVPVGTFVLVDIQDNDGRGDMLDPFNVHDQITGNLGNLEGLSFVFGDFEIR